MLSLLLLLLLLLVRLFIITSLVVYYYLPAALSGPATGYTNPKISGQKRLLPPSAA